MPRAFSASRVSCGEALLWAVAVVGAGAWGRGLFVEEVDDDEDDVLVVEDWGDEEEGIDRDKALDSGRW